MEATIRKSVIAGSWYPGETATLTRTVQGYLENATVPEAAAKPVALVSPHAGYMYSGQTAAYAYKAIQGQAYRRVVVISPSHRAAFPYVAVWAEGGYETPLGTIAVDQAFCRGLIDQGAFIQDDRRPHLDEHALEIQLPFLQTVLGDFQLCPLILGHQPTSLCRDLGEALARCIDDPAETLVVASSDLSHFHHAAQAVVMDTKVAALIQAYDIEGLGQALETGAVEACGGGPIISAMVYAAAKGCSTARVLKCVNSGDVTGERSSVVGYLAAVIP